ncbi:MAG TPA: hypothetical protein VNE83_04570 [Terriglobales bacterium]|nr:hypothetical protein [Terriglobales bacterium]
MKRIGFVGLTLSLLLAAAAAQQGPRRSDKDQHGRSRGHAEAEMHRAAPQHRDQEDRQRQAWQGREASHTFVARTWRERGGYHGARIPTAYYRGHFGRSHAFRVYRMPFAVVAGEPRFQFSGYWFDVVDPVPAYWGPAWYQNDDVYVVYRGGGYYLYNARFPRRPGISISVAF